LSREWNREARKTEDDQIKFHFPAGAGGAAETFLAFWRGSEGAITGAWAPA
jgi:hypothetical protein